MTVALMAAVMGAAAGGGPPRMAPSGGRARSRSPARLAVAAPLVLAAVGRLAGAETDVVATWTYEAAIVVTAGALAVDLLSGRSVRAAATGLVVDLAATPGASGPA